jgi:hypothetical protein
MKVRWIYSNEPVELTGETAGRKVRLRVVLYTGDEKYPFTDIANVAALDDEAEEFIRSCQAELRLWHADPWLA